VNPDRPVTLVPHGKLFLVSFAALRDRSDRYLLERHVLHYSPAISVLRYTARQPSNQPPSVLVVGNPAMPTLPGRTRPLSPLPGAELEARAIGTLFPPAQVTALTGTAALEHTVSGLAGGRTILHLATHGVIRDDDPLGSLLALAPGGSGPGGDGLWTAREVFDLRLSADLVTLSACNTGLGRVSGDGVIGLSRAFLYAGAPSVLVSLWRVADSVTRFEMERFYQELIASDGAKAKALRRAQLDTIAALRAGRLTSESGKTLPEDPAYWAPFVLVGEAN
jgi:CHAT domain-containing protein